MAFHGPRRDGGSGGGIDSVTNNVVDFGASDAPLTPDQGSSGISAALASTKGGISSVDAAYSLQNNFTFAAVQNRAGKFLLPDNANVAAAADTVQTVPSGNAISIVDPPASAAAAYPISTFTYAIVHKSSSKAPALRAFLTYAIGPGQQFGGDLEFAKLPQVVLDADRKAIAKIG